MSDRDRKRVLTMQAEIKELKDALTAVEPKMVRKQILDITDGGDITFQGLADKVASKYPHLDFLHDCTLEIRPYNDATDIFVTAMLLETWKDVDLRKERISHQIQTKERELRAFESAIKTRLETERAEYDRLKAKFEK